jgi:hypothetical protein
MFSTVTAFSKPVFERCSLDDGDYFFSPWWYWDFFREEKIKFLWTKIFEKHCTIFLLD